MPAQPKYRNPYLNMLATAWRYAGTERKTYLLVYAMFMMSNLVQVLYPIAWGVFINDIQQNGSEVLQSAWIYALVFVAIRFVDWAFHGPARIMERKLAFHLSRNFLQEHYHKALHLPLRWHQDNHSGATINRIRKAYEAIKKFFEDGFEYLHTFFKFVFSFAAMVYFTPLFGLVATSLGILVVWIILKFDKPYIQTLEQVNEKEHKVSSMLFDSLSNIVTVITLRLEKRMESGLLRRVSEIFSPFMKNVIINEWKWFIVDMLVGVIYAVILVGYVWQHWTAGEVFLIGGLVMVMGYVERFTSVFHNVAYLYTEVVQHNTDVTTALSILQSYEEHHLPEGVNPLPRSWKTLEISDLNFSYHEEPSHDRESSVTSRALDAKTANTSSDMQRRIGLTDVHLRIERGKRIALIGESGSGKSTLLALLRGLYDPNPGSRVIIDGTQRVEFDAIANHVTLFPQEPEIFENTLEYNITLGLPHEPGELESICQRVGFADVVDQLPKGLQSSIQEKGVNLSGGQKQRLALARGVFAAKDSDILLLDEPTSSVDPKTESAIYQRLFAESSDRAIVSALHRLHLLPRFDYIYLMTDGRIVDQGTFEHLAKNSPNFQDMWAHQTQSEE